MSIGQNSTGADFDLATTNPTFALGTLMLGQGGKVYIYLQANGAVTGDGYVVSFGSDFDAAMIDTDTAATVTLGRSIAVSDCEATDNQYFWGQVYGPCGVRSEASALANSKLAATADAGQVDDAGAVGSKFIDGLIFGTATGGADAVNATAFVNWPKIELVGTYA